MRHHDIDLKKRAVLHEYSKRINVPRIKAAREANKIFDTPEAKELLARMGVMLC